MKIAQTLVVICLLGFFITVVLDISWGILLFTVALLLVVTGISLTLIWRPDALD